MNSRTPARVNETKQTAARTPRRVWQLVLGAVVVFLSLLGGSVSAQAHDEVVGTTPQQGSVVPVMSGVVAISMSNTPAAIGAQIDVVDAAGKNWSTGSVTVLDRVASQAVLPGAPAGAYTVNWRLVSADGHEVEGTFSFTAEAALPGTAGNAPVAGTAQPVTEASEPAVAQAPNDSRIPWSIIALAVVLVGLVAAMVRIAKRRLGDAE